MTARALGGIPSILAMAMLFATGSEHPLAIVVDRNGVLIVPDGGRDTVYTIVYKGAR